MDTSALIFDDVSVTEATVFSLDGEPRYLVILPVRIH